MLAVIGHKVGRRLVEQRGVLVAQRLCGVGSVRVDNRLVLDDLGILDLVDVVNHRLWLGRICWLDGFGFLVVLLSDHVLLLALWLVFHNLGVDDVLVAGGCRLRGLVAGTGGRGSTLRVQCLTDA